MRDLVRHSIAMLRNPRLVLLHLVGNAVVLVAASFWLLIPEEHVWQLLLTAISALLIGFAFLWIHSGTLAYAAEPVPEKLQTALSPKIGRVLWLLFGLFILLWCMSIVDGWSDSNWQISGYLYSKAPSWLRPTSGDSAWYRILDYLFSIVYWYVLPCLFLPAIAAKIAGSGALRGLRTLGRWQYWLAMAITTLLGVWVTRRILGWMPGRTLSVQTVSLAVRLALAYVIATAAWLLTAGLLGYFVGSGNKVEDVSWKALWKRVFPPAGQAHSMMQHCLAVVRNKRLLALQMAGGVVLAIAAGLELQFQWDTVLGIAGAIAGVLLLLVAFLWLHSGTLVYAAEPVPERFCSAFRLRFRRMGWLFLALVILLIFMIGPDVLLRPNAGDVSSWWSGQAINFISWYLAPCLVLPWAMAKVGIGGRLGAGFGALRSWRYWAGMAVIIFPVQVLADWLPVWRFGMMGLRTEVMVAIRSAVIYLPYIAGWMLAAGLVGYFVRPRNEGASANLVGQAAS